MSSGPGAVEIVLGGAFVLWLLVSVICQLPWRAADVIRRFDLAGLIPFWSFFAPNPGIWDYHLLYRDQLADGTITDWREIPLCEPRRWFHAVWNPRRREKKCLFDLTTGLMREAVKADERTVQLSVPYLALLVYVTALPRASLSERTQFVLMSSFGTTSDQQPTPMFTSTLHPL